MPCLSCEERRRLAKEALQHVANGMDMKAALEKVALIGSTIARDVEHWGPSMPWRGWRTPPKS